MRDTVVCTDVREAHTYASAYASAWRMRCTLRDDAGNVLMRSHTLPSNCEREQRARNERRRVKRAERALERAERAEVRERKRAERAERKREREQREARRMAAIARVQARMQASA